MRAVARFGESRSRTVSGDGGDQGVPERVGARFGESGLRGFLRVVAQAVRV
jgi:hypothetical protein